MECLLRPLFSKKKVERVREGVPPLLHKESNSTRTKTLRKRKVGGGNCISLYVYLRIMITTCFITMAVATCTVTIPLLLPTEVVSCVVSFKVAFMSS